MEKNHWQGIMKILEIQHWRDGRVIWEQKNVKNLLHLEGEEYILRAAFTGGKTSDVIPERYYLGLDNREVVNAEDTMDFLITEPTGNGYTRQDILSAGDFTVSKDENSGHYRAISPIVAFQASGGTWGPVQNLFLTDTADSTGYLISTAKLDTIITVSDGDSVTMRISLQLKDCS